MQFFKAGKYFATVSLLGVCFLSILASLQAQSIDARSPTAVRSNEVVGRIAARDIGDARLTDHFYTFVGTPGDLLITIDTRNLNGDIDVFTAGSLRPVFKVAIYAEVSQAVTKSVYLRQREELILRVEARSPNDDDGIYHLRFGGSFEPVMGAAENVDESTSDRESTINQPVRRGQRVSSVGARIKEPNPPPEVAAAPAPEPTPAIETPTPEPKAEAPAEATSKPARNARSRPKSRGGRSTATAPKEITAKPITDTEAPKNVEDANKVEPAVTESVEPPAVATPARKNAKKSRGVRSEPADTTGSAKSESAASPKSPESKREDSTTTEEDARQPEENPAKLVIEMLDGTRVEHDMSSVRRVTVENGQIVVTRTDGTTERIRLGRVVRMSIGRQN